MHNYLRLIRYVKAHLWVLALAGLFMLLSSVLQPVSFGMFIPFIDRVLVGQEISIAHEKVPAFITDLVAKINSVSRERLLLQCVFVGIILFLLRFLFRYIQQYLMREVSQRVVRDIRNIIYEKLLRLSLNFYSGSQTGTLVSRITYDSTIIQDAVAEGLTDLVLETCTFVFTLIMVIGVVRACEINPAFVVIGLIIMPIVAVPLIMIGRRLRQISKRSQESMAGINNVLYETISGIRIVKGFCMELYEGMKFRKQNAVFKKTVMKSNKRVLAVSPISELVTLICAMTIIWLAGIQVIRGHMQVGELTLFVALIWSLSKPIKRLSRVHIVNQQALAAATRIFEILDTEVDVVEKNDAVELTRISDGIVIDNVSFKYDKKEVLRNISLDVKIGEIVALVGPSGAGKTTLVNLIPRFYDPVRGRILVDNYNLKDLRLVSLRDQIGIVTQETVLFNDRVSANISYGKSEANREKVIEAAKTANAHDFIMKMPAEYETVIGERGFRLSGGERQRLAIARAVFKNPPVLIFDEATSQLDSESEKLVQEAIDRLMEGRTVFVIAHRLSTIKHASKIVVIDKGEIVDIGTHDELIERVGIYSRLYNMQFAGV